MWRSDTRNVAARASAVRLGQTEGGNARSSPYLIGDGAGAGQKRELNAQVKRLPQRPRTHAKDLASVRQTRRYASHPTGAPEPLRAGRVARDGSIHGRHDGGHGYTCSRGGDAVAREAEHDGAARFLLRFRRHRCACTARPALSRAGCTASRWSRLGERLKESSWL